MMISLSIQEILISSLLTNQFSVSLVLSVKDSKEIPVEVSLEQIKDVNPQILAKSRIQFSKSKLFDYTQEIQRVSSVERKIIYEKVHQLDVLVDQEQAKVMKIADKKVR